MPINAYRRCPIQKILASVGADTLARSSKLLSDIVDSLPRELTYSAVMISGYNSSLPKEVEHRARRDTDLLGDLRHRQP